MIMIVNVSVLFVTLSLFLTINVTYIHAQQLQASNGFANDYKLDLHGLPRKLMSNKKVEGFEANSYLSPNEKSKGYSGESDQVEVMVQAAKGTRRHEWIEGSDPTHEYFTMDYSHVRRRRPIHNKSFPKLAVTNSP